MQLILLGLNHRVAPVQVRERLAVAPSHLPNVLRALRDTPGVDQVAIVSTCNRLEIYAAVDDAASRQAPLIDALAEQRGLRACDFRAIWTSAPASQPRNICSASRQGSIRCWWASIKSWGR